MVILILSTTSPRGSPRLIADPYSPELP